MVRSSQLITIMTPSGVMLCTWQMFRHGEGNAADFPRVPQLVNTISFDFEQFSFRLFSSAQVRTFISSLVLVSELTAGTIT